MQIVHLIPLNAKIAPKLRRRIGTVRTEPVVNGRPVKVTLSQHGALGTGIGPHAGSCSGGLADAYGVFSAAPTAVLALVWRSDAFPPHFEIL